MAAAGPSAAQGGPVVPLGPRGTAAAVIGPPGERPAAGSVEAGTSSSDVPRALPANVEDVEALLEATRRDAGAGTDMSLEHLGRKVKDSVAACVGVPAPAPVGSNQVAPGLVLPGTVRARVADVERLAALATDSRVVRASGVEDGAQSSGGGGRGGSRGRRYQKRTFYYYY